MEKTKATNLFVDPNEMHLLSKFPVDMRLLGSQKVKKPHFEFVDFVKNLSIGNTCMKFGTLVEQRCPIVQCPIVQCQSQGQNVLNK